MKGITPQTSKIIEPISRLDIVKNFVLVGGTALSIQIGARESEDLDFMRWRIDKKDNLDVDWNKIRDELSSIGEIEHINLMDFNHVEFIFEGVKLSFYASDNYSPISDPIPFLNNIFLADIQSIGAMKMEVLLRRSNFRDYYDIFTILNQGISLDAIIEQALKYSGHRLKKKNLIMMLTSSERFKRDQHFNQLNPKYDVTSKDIENYIKSILTC